MGVNALVLLSALVSSVDNFIILTTLTFVVSHLIIFFYKKGS